MILHWSLILIEWNPFNLPDNFSSLLDGGILRSEIFCELLSILNLRLLISCISLGKLLTLSPIHIFSVSFDPKDIIILTHYGTYAKGKHFFQQRQVSNWRSSLDFSKLHYLYYMEEKRSMKGMKLRIFNSWEEAAEAEAMDSAKQSPVERLRETVELILRVYGVTREELSKRAKKLHITITRSE
jgi:hypothetical protein